MANLMEEGDAPDTGPSPYVISPGDTFNGFLFEPEDEDVISFQIDDNGADYVFLFSPDSGVLDNAIGEIQFPDGRPLTSLTTFSGSELIIKSIPSPLRPNGLYNFEVRSYNDRDLGGYTFELISDTGDGFNGVTNGYLAESASITDRLDYEGDRDWFQLEMVESRSNTVIVTPTSSISDDFEFNTTLISDGRIRAYPALFDDGMAVLTQLGLGALTDVDWFASVYSLVDSTGLSYSVEHVVDALPNLDSHLRMEVGEPFESSLDFRGDRDAVGITLEARGRYHFSVEGDGALTPENLVLDDFGSTGLLFLSGTSSNDPHNEFIARLNRNEDSLIFLTVRSNDGVSTGNYRILVERSEVIQGTSGIDMLEGFEGSDTITGLNGDDTITGAGGEDSIDGGAGSDTSVYSADKASHTVTLSSSSISVQDRRSDGDGTDQLVDIENLSFLDTEWLLDIFDDVVGLTEQAFRDFIEVYIAYFNRAPDAEGLFFYGTAFANGTSLEDSAATFLNSAEYQATYPPGLSNQEFAEAVYDNVLGRIPDLLGLEFWVGVLDSGARSRDVFILEVLKGAKAPAPDDATQDFIDQKAADVAYLANKTDIGLYFAVTKGMSNVTNATAAMQLFDDGDQADIDAAVAAIDGFYTDALDPVNGEFLLQLVGVVDDPFLI